VARVVGYTGRIVFDPSRPDGTPRKLLDVSRVRVGWHAQIPLEKGIASTYEWYMTHASGGVVHIGELRLKLVTAISSQTA
jgi:nucleoside-diphosphate-sugar epimerase